MRQQSGLKLVHRQKGQQQPKDQEAAADADPRISQSFDDSRSHFDLELKAILEI